MLGINNLIIVYCDYGRIGNRLHTHANALAWCIENNYNLINLSFSEYANLFKSSPMHNSGNLYQNENFLFKLLSSRIFRNFLRRLLLSDKWLERLAWIINQIIPTNNEILKETNLCRQINRNKINLIKYWDISCRNCIDIQQHKLRDYLRPNNIFAATSEKTINNLRLKYDCLVGVHARRGDYATYLDGKHYHSWESYLEWSNQIKEVLEKSGKRTVGIVICSDELPPTSISKEQAIHFSLSREFMVDIHLLSNVITILAHPTIRHMDIVVW